MVARMENMKYVINEHFAYNWHPANLCRFWLHFLLQNEEIVATENFAICARV